MQKQGLGARETEWLILGHSGTHVKKLLLGCILASNHSEQTREWPSCQAVFGGLIFTAFTPV